MRTTRGLAFIIDFFLSIYFLHFIPFFPFLLFCSLVCLFCFRVFVFIDFSYVIIELLNNNLIGTQLASLTTHHNNLTLH